MNQTTIALGRNYHRFLDGARAPLTAMLLAAALLAANPPAAAAEAEAEAETPKVNLNHAGAEALQYIPRIGPRKAADIIRVRAEMAGFKEIDDLLEVPGIGEKILLEIKKHGTLKGGVVKLSEGMRADPPGMAVMQHEDGEDGEDSKDGATGG